MLPLINARYNARAVACAFSFTKDDARQVSVQFQIVEPAGETIIWNGYFTDKTEDRTIESLQHMGWKGDDLAELHECDCSVVLPSEVQLVCETDSYNDETKLKVRWVNRLGLVVKKPMGAHDLKAFAAQMRGKIRSAGGATGPRQQTTPARQTQTAPHPNAPPGYGAGYAASAGPDDDIPFASADMAHEPSSISRILRRSF